MGKVLLVGCGKMGGAILEGWLAHGHAASEAVVAEPVEAIRPRRPGLRVVASSSEVSETPDLVVLAVKPQLMDSVLPDLRRFAEQVLPAVAEHPVKPRCIVGRGDHLDVADPGQDQCRQRVVDERLVIDRNELLADTARDGVQPRPRAAGQYDALH